MIKVVKFGGSSVANSTQFEKVKKIIDEDRDRKFIVTSACGKETHEDHKVTDLLYLCAAHVKYGVSYDSIFQLIEDKYMSIKNNLGLKTDLETEFSRIRSIIDRDLNTDYLVSRGEYLTGLLLAEYLDAEFVDAAEVMMLSTMMGPSIWSALLNCSTDMFRKAERSWSLASMGHFRTESLKL
jgi:Aspartokinases